MTSRMSEKIQLLGIINPGANAAGTLTTGWVPMANYLELMATVAVGTITANGTVDAKLQQAKDGSGTGVKDVAGKAITQLTQAGTDKSNKQAVINMRAEELDRTNGFTHVRLSMTGATAAAGSVGILQGTSSRYSPADPAASVIETIG